MTQWNSGLFGCFDDVPICLLGTCCPCLLFGNNVDKIDGEGKIPMCLVFLLTSPCCLSCLVHKPRREKLRSAYGLEEKPSDFIATCICGGCGNCQMAREMKHRGIGEGQRIPVSSQPR